MSAQFTRPHRARHAGAAVTLCWTPRPGGGMLANEEEQAWDS
jgi:hypothetical protein